MVLPVAIYGCRGQPVAKREDFRGTEEAVALLDEDFANDREGSAGGWRAEVGVGLGEGTDTYANRTGSVAEK